MKSTGLNSYIFDMKSQYCGHLSLVKWSINLGDTAAGVHHSQTQKTNTIILVGQLTKQNGTSYE